MELKDVILSTLAEMEDDNTATPTSLSVVNNSEKTMQKQDEEQEVTQSTDIAKDSELVYLSSIRERLLVLFEGFQAPNNTNIEAKVDMTLNFLEYTLATIDLRVEKLEKGAKQ